MTTTLRLPFSAGTYIHAILQMITTPREFFAGMNTRAWGPGQAAFFLALTGAIFAGATPLVYRLYQPLTISGILFLNAVGMCALAVVIGYGLMGLLFGKKTALCKLFTVYAFASGTTLILAWIPYALAFTEIWKWWLIYVGLTNGCGLGKKQAALVVMLSIVVIILFFRSLLAIII